MFDIVLIDISISKQTTHKVERDTLTEDLNILIKKERNIFCLVFDVIHM